MLLLAELPTDDCNAEAQHRFGQLQQVSSASFCSSSENTPSTNIRSEDVMIFEHVEVQGSCGRGLHGEAAAEVALIST